MGTNLRVKRKNEVSDPTPGDASRVQAGAQDRLG